MVLSDKERKRRKIQSQIQKIYRQRINRKKFPNRWKIYRRNRYVNIMYKIRLIKAKIGCQNCGYPDPVVLHFHHRNPKNKLFTIGDSITKQPWKKILKEIKKCNVLCANCHLLHHYNNAN